MYIRDHPSIIELEQLERNLYILYLQSLAENYKRGRFRVFSPFFMHRSRNSSIIFALTAI